jgi:hypothetical protein
LHVRDEPFNEHCLSVSSSDIQRWENAAHIKV